MRAPPLVGAVVGAVVVTATGVPPITGALDGTETGALVGAIVGGTPVPQPDVCDLSLPLDRKHWNEVRPVLPPIPRQAFWRALSAPGWLHEPCPRKIWEPQKLKVPLAF